GSASTFQATSVRGWRSAGAGGALASACGGFSVTVVRPGSSFEALLAESSLDFEVVEQPAQKQTNDNTMARAAWAARRWSTITGVLASCKRPRLSDLGEAKRRR